jgi:hypothetical protein
MTIPAIRRQRAKRGEKTAKTGDAADTLSNHLIGEGLGKPEITGFAVSCVSTGVPPFVDSASSHPYYCSLSPSARS